MIHDQIAGDVIPVRRSATNSYKNVVPVRGIWRISAYIYQIGKFDTVLLVKNVISVRPDSPVTFFKSNLGRETAKSQSFPLICTLGCLGVKDVTDIISRETSDIANEHKKEALGPRGFP